jgi:hypothetical protein
MKTPTEQMDAFFYSYPTFGHITFMLYLLGSKAIYLGKGA